MNFLPDNYESPKSNTGYMKLEDGENKIRILTLPILGWEDWKDNKPVRFRLNNKPEKSFDPAKKIKHFWALVVWNYGDQKIQILQITQVGIQRALENLSKDVDWGNPYYYDLKIVRSGKDQQTKYAVTPSPKRDVDEAVKEEFAKLSIDLEELYRGGDPFRPSGKGTLPFWESLALPVASKSSDEEPINKKEEASIEASIAIHVASHDKEWRENALKALKIDSFAQLKRKYLPLVMKRIEEKRESIAKLAELADEVPF